MANRRRLGEAWLGAARRTRGDPPRALVVTVAAHDLVAGHALIMTTYRSDGHTIDPGEPFVEATTTAASTSELAFEIWCALVPEHRVAVAAFGALAARTAQVALARRRDRRERTGS